MIRLRAYNLVEYESWRKGKVHTLAVSLAPLCEANIERLPTDENLEATQTRPDSAGLSRAYSGYTPPNNPIIMSDLPLLRGVVVQRFDRDWRPFSFVRWYAKRAVLPA